MKRFSIIVLVIMLMVGVLANLSLAAEYKDGEYIGYVPNEHGDVVIAVAIVKGFITNVEILSPVKHVYKYEPGQKAFYEYPQKVIKAQSADIDAVAGATHSYQDYNKAVQMALDMASGTYKGNKFYGLSRDYAHGHILVEVTLNDARDKIVDIRFITQNEKLKDIDTLMAAKSDKYPHAPAVEAFKSLPEQALKRQNVHVDTISGATHLSTGFYEALLQALDSAGVRKKFE